MTPKEKAEELVLKYLRIDNNTKEWFNMHIAKQCALIAVDELIKEQTMWQNGEVNPVLYWQEVKNEINKL
jgi:hypothetical protein